MLVARLLPEIPFDKNSVVSVGSFDGVHRAHQEVIREVVRRAGSREGRSVIVTFDPHPKQVLQNNSGEIRLLSTLDERKTMCQQLGVNVFFVIPFTYEFSRQGFREFYEKYLVRGIGVSEVVEGYDHHFGRDREGSIQELIRMGEEFDFSVIAMKPVTVDGEIVNSTAIRRHLQGGNVTRAAELLGRPYRIEGSVVRGDGRGKKLGFPTANVVPSQAATMVPANGVYVAQVLLEKTIFHGLVNIGVRPTFEKSGMRAIEAHLLHFEGDLYGKRLEVLFLKRLRDEMKFESPEDLVQQMQLDKQAGLEFINEHHHEVRAQQSGN